MRQRLVLIIDDIPSDITKISALFLPDRFGVLIARSGPEALAVLGQNPGVDSIVLDLKFDGQLLQGRDILDRIRDKREFDPVSVIILTAERDTRVASNLLRHGADDYMDKDQLNDLVSHVVISIAKARIRQLRRLVLTALDRGQVFRQVLEILDKLREPELAFLLLISRDGDACVLNEANLPLGDPLGRTAEVELFDRVHRAGRFFFAQGSEAARLHPQKLVARSLLAVSIFGDSEGRGGLICLFSDDPEGIDPDWVGPITELADLVAIGLEISSKAEELARQKASLAREAERQSWSHVPLVLGELRHRIATPCNVMLNHLESLVSKEFQDPDMDRLRPELRSEISRRLNVLRRNADSVRKECDYITRIMAAHPIERTTFDLVGLLDDCLEEIRPELDNNHIEGQFHRGGHIGIKVIADEEQIKYSIQCVLRNALEAILEKRRQSLDPATRLPSGDRVMIGLKPNSQAEAVFDICDTGIGIPAENQERLFQPLFTTKQRQRSGGFGLFGVKRILRAHGGNVELIQSDRDRGSIFEVSIPLQSNEPAS